MQGVDALYANIAFANLANDESFGNARASFGNDNALKFGKTVFIFFFYFTGNNNSVTNVECVHLDVMDWIIVHGAVFRNWVFGMYPKLTTPTG